MIDISFDPFWLNVININGLDAWRSQLDKDVTLVSEYCFISVMPRPRRDASYRDSSTEINLQLPSISVCAARVSMKAIEISELSIWRQMLSLASAPGDHFQRFRVSTFRLATPPTLETRRRFQDLSCGRHDWTAVVSSLTEPVVAYLIAPCQRHSSSTNVAGSSSKLNKSSPVVAQTRHSDPGQF